VAHSSREYPRFPQGSTSFANRCLARHHARRRKLGRPLLTVGVLRGSSFDQLLRMGGALWAPSVVLGEAHMRTGSWLGSQLGA
jgi:hypothetical protein